MISSTIIRTIAISLIMALTLPLAAPLAVTALENNGPHTDNSPQVTTGEVKQALQHTPGVLSASDQSTATSDADSAIVAATAGTTVDIPKDASDGVTLATHGGPTLDIQLPNAHTAGDAKQIAPGVVAYSAGNGSANAVQANEDGSVRMLTVIDNRNAPTAYDYKVTVPDGGHIQLTETGGAEVVMRTGEIVAAIDAPWAKDARGKHIRTWFTTDGQTLTQHVQHRVRGVVYPVVVDPIWFAVSAAVFWWAVQRCGAGGAIGAVFEYVGGSRSPRAIAAAGTAGCIASFVGGWGILKNIVRIVRW